MKFGKLLIVLAILTAPVIALSNDTEAFGQFQEVLMAMDDRSFDTFRRAIDKSDMRNRVLSARTVSADVVQVFDTSFWEIMQAGFEESLPPDGSNASIKLVDFASENGEGKAAVRFTKPGFEYSSLIFDLRHDSAVQGHRDRRLALRGRSQLSNGARRRCPRSGGRA